MRPDARVQSAIQIVDAWIDGSEALDRILTRWGRENRFAGSGDRHAIADLVYAAVRRMRSAAWVGAGGPARDARSIIAGSLSLDSHDAATLFSGERHAPERLPDGWTSVCLDDAPDAVRFDVPNWLTGESIGVTGTEFAALRDRGALDLRVNTLKADRETAIACLADDGIVAVPHTAATTALRVTDGSRKVARSRAYLDGLVEIQDAASQAVAALSMPRAGETVLDLCAGGGGKALALAALAGNEARILATDISARRLENIPERAQRAGARIDVLETAPDQALHQRCDLVFVDAPCSGAGAWRRNPDAKWAFTPDRLQALVATQAALLARAARLTRPGGRIVFATCSMLPAEGADHVEQFLSQAPGWTLNDTSRALPSGGTDGFFGAVFAHNG